MPPFHWWRTVFYLIPLVSIYTIALGTLSIVASLMERHGRVAHRCARAWAWLILATTGVRVRRVGLERLAPDTAYVFASNHESIYDIPIIFANLPREFRILAKDSLGRVPFLGGHLRRAGHILVRRESPGTAVFRRVAALMQYGFSLVVFPEGTRSAGGQVGRFKRGIFLLAIESGCPVVPVAVLGSRHVMPRGRLMVCPGEVGLILHEPIRTEGLSGDAAGELAARVEQIVQAACTGTPVHRCTSAPVPEP